MNRYWYDFEDCNGAKLVDFVEDKEYSLETIGDFMKIEELLNKQDNTIKELKLKIAEQNEKMESLEKLNHMLQINVKKLSEDVKFLAKLE